MRILLTGADGFVGAHMLKYLLENTDAEIVCPVSLRHKGSSARLRHVLMHRQGADGMSRVKFIMHDLTAPFDARTIEELDGDTGCHVIMNVASESHVDRSITDPVPFVQNNVALMLNVLEYARHSPPYLFLQMSTDEVYGPAPSVSVPAISRDVGDLDSSRGFFDTGEDVWADAHPEWSPILPSNPYSASKAAQEAIAISYWRTYGVPVVLTNTMNIFGEMQDPEKYPAKVVSCLKSGEPVPVHVDEYGNPGSRFYLHAENLADAWWFLVKTRHAEGDLGVPMYADGHERPLRLNIVGEREVDNLQFAHDIAEAMDDVSGLHYREENFHASRPGHDLRYALDGSKLAALGWEAPVSYEDGIRRMVKWYEENPEWLS